MRVYDLGSTFRVAVSSQEVQDFRAKWPCSGLSTKNGIAFEYDKRNGDLVDVRHSDSEDGAALAALSHDAQAYGERRLGIKR